jgi:hypothetical protein
MEARKNKGIESYLANVRLESSQAELGIFHKLLFLIRLFRERVRLRGLVTKSIARNSLIKFELKVISLTRSMISGAVVGVPSSYRSARDFLSPRNGSYSKMYLELSKSAQKRCDFVLACFRISAAQIYQGFQIIRLKH